MIKAEGGIQIRYSAFISYNYADRRWARWLHRALEEYRVPRHLQGGKGSFGVIGARLPPVFRDRDELAASSDLGLAVRTALDDSAFLIVICSPASARSHWVNSEIRHFITTGRLGRIRCLIVDGEPHAADPDKECIPPALLEDGNAEPLAADLRPNQDGKSAARLKLIAGILGLPYDQLRQRENQRRQRRLAALAAGSTLGFAITAALAIFAFLSRAEAVEQRNLAIQRTRVAERTVGFVKSMFQVSDPSESRGETVTARDILESGTRKIASGLKDEPEVRADLALTLSEVFASLGSYRQSDRLIRWSYSISHREKDLRARQWIAFAEARYNLGEYDAAEVAYRRAINLLADASTLSTSFMPRARVGLGQTLTALGRSAEAERQLKGALETDLKQLGSGNSDVARDFEALGRNALMEGNFKRAQSLVSRALALRLKTEGNFSPSVSDNLSTLGSIAYFQGELPKAKQLFASRLEIDEKVLGAAHPDVGVSLNNLARVMLELRQPEQALPLLERAVKITQIERGETHDQMAFMLANLGIAFRELGDVNKARPLFERALIAARLHQHRNLAPILTDLADLHCGKGEVRTGLKLLAEARPTMLRDYPDDLWRVAWTDTIRSKCLWALGEKEQARTLITRSGQSVKQRWPAGTLYRHVLDQLTRDVRSPTDANQR